MRAVAIIDPNPLFALGLSLLVARCGIGQAEVWHDVPKAADALASQPADLHLVSERLIGEFAETCLAPSTPLILIIDGNNSALFGKLQSVHVDGYLLRDASEEKIARCLVAVASGHAWLDPNLCDRIVQRQRCDPRCLSKRELQIAALAADGESNKLIARTLHLSEGTVKIHLHHVFAKLRVGKRRELHSILGKKTAMSAGTQAPSQHDFV